MTWISARLVNLLIDKKVIRNDTESIAFYRYGIEITLSSVLNIFLVLLIGVILCKILEAVTFLAIFVFLRSFSGGYHAGSYIKCNVIMCISFIAISFISEQIANDFALIMMIIFVSAISLPTVIIFAPVDNKYKPVKEENRLKYKLISITLCVLIISISSIGVFFDFVVKKIGATILLTVLLIAIMIIISKLIERRKEND